VSAFAAAGYRAATPLGAGLALTVGEA
jgi:hypothetical protein